MFRNIESLCCVPGTTTALKVNFNSKLNILIENKIREVGVKGKGIRRSGQKYNLPTTKYILGM